MIVIDSSTAVAQSEADLRSAVSNAYQFTHIYLDTDITLTAGITIDPNKTSLTIDGEYPIGSGNIHQFTDMASTQADATIGIRGTSSITLTFKSLIINGRNFYGVPYITDSILVNTTGVTVVYENVRYTGPQITYNIYGTTRYIDCNITISASSVSAAEEVGEVNRVEIGGVTNITHGGTDDAVFYFRGNSATMAFTILENARVSIHSVNYFSYNMVPVLETPYPVPYVIRSGADFYLEINKGIAYNSNNPLASLRVEDSAAFRYVQTGNNAGFASMYMNGALTVGEGSVFYMQASNGTQPLIVFSSGTGRSLTVSNPLSFVLYSPNASALHSNGTTQFTIHGGQLNTWNPATVPVTSAGDFNDIPDFKWFKKDYLTALDLTGSFTQTATTTATNNLTADDQPYPALTNLHLHDARVISVGDWNVVINPVTDDGDDITGHTQAGANLRVVYTPAGGTEHIISGAAGEDGRFAIATTGETPPEIPAGTSVAIWSNIPFLIKTTPTTAIAAGDLMIVQAPVHIVLNRPTISAGPDIFLRRFYPMNDEPVIVNDSRTDSTYWDLLASITGDLTTADGVYSLPGALVFRNDDDSLITLSGTPAMVYKGDPNGGAPKTTDVTWAANRGILLQVTQPIQVGVEYSTTLIWDLQIDETT